RWTLTWPSYISSIIFVVTSDDLVYFFCFFFFQAEDGIRDRNVTGVQTCALPIFSDKNLLPADELSLLLVKVQDQSWFPVFQNSLPVAGEPDRLIGGTLRNRMTDDSTKGNVKAKTGSLTGVSALSGYVTSKDGEELTFSLIFNHYVGGSVTAIEDVIATVLAEHEFNEE